MFAKKVASNRPKNSSQILVISEKRLWKAILYYSNFIKKIAKCSQNFWTFLFRLSFVLRQKFVVDKKGCFVTRLCTFAHSYLSTYFPNIQWHHYYCGKDSTFSVIQRYFCHKHDTHEHICLSIFFSQYYCNSCSFLLSYFLL